MRYVVLVVEGPGVIAGVELVTVVVVLVGFALPLLDVCVVVG